MRPLPRTAIALATLLLLTALLYFALIPAPTPASAPKNTTAAPAEKKPALTAAQLRSTFAELMALPEGEERRRRFSEWLASLPDDQIPLVAELFRTTSRHDAIDDELGLVLERWVAFAPVAALDFTATLLPRDSLLIRPARQALAAWLARDPAATLDYLKNMRRDLTEWRSILVKGTAAILAENNFDAALAWAAQPDAQRNRSLEVVASAARTPEAQAKVGEILSSLSDRPGESQDAILQFAPTLAQTNPRAALEWASTSIIDPELRQTTLLETIRHAGQTSPKDVAAWLQSAQLDTLLADPTQSRAPDQFVDDILLNFLLGVAESTDPAYALANLDLLSDPKQQDRVLRRYYHTLDLTSSASAWDSPTTAPLTDPALLARAQTLRAQVDAALAAQPTRETGPLRLSSYTIATTAGLAPVPAGPINSKGAIYSVSSPEPVEFRLANPRREPGTAIVSTLDRDAIPVTQVGDEILFKVLPGQVAVIDYGAGNEVHLSVVPPSPPTP